MTINKIEELPECPICGSSRRIVFSDKILGKHTVDYWLCSACELLQTEDPYWLEEAYSSAISTADTGLVCRNIQFSRLLAPLLNILDGGKQNYLDTAGGYGMLTRLMRDAGFQFYWEDVYCKNILAVGSEGKKEFYSAVTAFEVLEHVHDPLRFLNEVCEKTKCQSFILSTELYKGPTVPAKDWWFFCQETGQHISFFTKRTMEVLATKLNFSYLAVGQFHVFSKNKNIWKLNFLNNRVLRNAMKFREFLKNESLMEGDRKRALELMVDSGETR